MDEQPGLIEARAQEHVELLGEFAGRNLTIGQSRVVHAVRVEDYRGGAQAPGPACRVGVAGDAQGRLTPTMADVTCVRPGCREAALPRPRSEQLMLWDAPIKT